MNIVAEIVSARTKDRNPHGSVLQQADGQMYIYKVIYCDDNEIKLKETQKKGRLLAYKLNIKGCTTNPRYYGIKKGIIVEMKGTVKEAKKDTYLFEATDIVVQSSHALRKLLDDQGIDIKAKREKLVKDTGGEKILYSDSLDEDQQEFTQDVVAINAWLVRHGYKVDIDMAYDINTFFTYRMRDFHEDSVVDMLERHPHILAEIDYEMGGLFSIDKISQHFPNDKASIEEKAFAKLCMMLHHRTQNGDSFVMMRTAVGWLKKELYAMGLTDFISQAKWINDAIKEHNEGIMSRNAKFDRYRGYSRIYRLTQKDAEAGIPQELAKYYSVKFGRTVPAKWFNGALYLARSRNAEKEAARLLAQHVGEHPYSALLGDLKTGENIPPQYSFIKEDKDCMQALANAFKYRMSAIVGCAGSGKSTLVGAMVNMLNAHGLGDKTLLLAPSAMASAVAADKVREANDIKECAHHMTIHRFAKMTAEESDMGTEYGYDFDDADELLSEGIKFLIIDETSMCTIQMLHKLLKELEGNSDVHIVFVGDAAQLPAIGQQFFYLIADEDSPFQEYIPTVRFNVNHRAESSDIDKMTQDIREGKDIVIPPDSKSVSIEPVSMEAYFKKHKRYSKNTLYIASNASDVNTLNEILMGMHLGKEDRRAMVAGTSFAIGEKVMNIKNDYSESSNRRNKHRHPKRNQDIYNGTFGVIKSYDAEKDTVMAEMTLPDAAEKRAEIPYTSKELHRFLQAAYAISVHKSQGSQAENVVFFASNKMRRQMLYTAATRAKKKLTIVGTLDQLNEATKKLVQPGLTALFPRFEIELKKQVTYTKDIAS